MLPDKVVQFVQIRPGLLILATATPSDIYTYQIGGELVGDGHGSAYHTAFTGVDIEA